MKLPDKTEDKVKDILFRLYNFFTDVDIYVTTGKSSVSVFGNDLPDPQIILTAPEAEVNNSLENPSEDPLPPPKFPATDFELLL